MLCSHSQRGCRWLCHCSTKKKHWKHTPLDPFGFNPVAWKQRQMQLQLPTWWGTHMFFSRFTQVLWAHCLAQFKFTLPCILQHLHVGICPCNHHFNWCNNKAEHNIGNWEDNKTNYGLYKQQEACWVSHSIIQHVLLPLLLPVIGSSAHLSYPRKRASAVPGLTTGGRCCHCTPHGRSGSPFRPLSRWGSGPEGTDRWRLEGETRREGWGKEDAKHGEKKSETGGQQVRF